MTNNELLSAVRKLEQNGVLKSIANYDDTAGLMALFILSILEMKLPCDVKLLPGLFLHKNVPVTTLLLAVNNRADYESDRAAMTPEERESHDRKLVAFAEEFGLNVNSIEKRAERAAQNIYDKTTVSKYEIPVIKNIIASAIRGE